MDINDNQNESISYQKMLESVESIVVQLSSNQMDLDNMVNKVEKGYELIRLMRQKLNSTKEKVEKLRVEFENTVNNEDK